MLQNVYSAVGSACTSVGPTWLYCLMLSECNNGTSPCKAFHWIVPYTCPQLPNVALVSSQPETAVATHPKGRYHQACVTRLCASTFLLLRKAIRVGSPSDDAGVVFKYTFDSQYKAWPLHRKLHRFAMLYITYRVCL